MKIKKHIYIKLAVILVCQILGFTGCEDLPQSPSGADDASLSALSISKGTLTPDFAAAIIDYSVLLAVTETVIAVTPTAANSEAAVSVNNTPVASGAVSGDILLNPGVNEIKIDVTSQDGSITKTYTVKAVVGGVDLSGTLSLPNGEDASGKAVHIGLIEDFEENTDDTMFVTGSWASGSTQDYQLTGVPAGTYYLYALIDWNGDGIFDDSYPDYGGLSGFSFDSLSAMPGGGSPPGDANIIVADSNLTSNITDIQQIPAAAGTVKVSLTGAAAEAGERFGFSVFTPDSGGTMVGQHGFIIDDEGKGEQLALVLEDYPNGDPFIGVEGSSYQIFMMIDQNENDAFDPGEPNKLSSVLTMTGTIEISVEYTELFPPDP